MKKVTLENGMMVEVIEATKDGYNHIYMMGREWGTENIAILKLEVEDLEKQNAFTADVLKQTYFLIQEAYRKANNEPAQIDEQTVSWF